MGTAMDAGPRGAYPPGGRYGHGVGGLDGRVPILVVGRCGHHVLTRAAKTTPADREHDDGRPRARLPQGHLHGLRRDCNVAIDTPRTRRSAAPAAPREPPWHRAARNRRPRPYGDP